MLATAICEKNEWYPLGLKVTKGLVGARQRVGTSYKNSIDTDSRQWWAYRALSGEPYSNANANSGFRVAEAADVCRARRRGNR